MTIIGLDPGNEKSAIVDYDQRSKAIIESHYTENANLIAWLRRSYCGQTLVIEMIASYGMPVGQEVFETCVWIGRFAQAWGLGSEAQVLYRKDVKLHLCGASRAKDANVRAALLDKFGGSKACGTKKTPGPLYGISGDKWAALAVAVTWAETRASRPHASVNLLPLDAGL